MLTKDRILAKIIIDKTGDIPDWVYENTTEQTIIELILLLKKDNDLLGWYLNLNNNPTVRDNVCRFLKQLPEKRRITYRHLCRYISKHLELFPLGLSLFPDEDTWLNTIVISPEGIDEHMLITLLKYAVKFQDDILPNQPATIIHSFGYGIPYDTILSYIKQAFFNNEVLLKKSTILQFYKLMNEELKWSSNYEYCMTALLDYNLPVLYHGEDIPALIMYLQCIIDNSYTIPLDPDLPRIMNNLDIHPDFILDTSYKTQRVRELLSRIGYELNADTFGFLPAIPQGTPVEEGIKRFFSGNPNKLPVSDFKTLYLKYANYNGYAPEEIQLEFLRHGGDVQTMLDENGNLLKQVTIFGNKDYSNEIFDMLSIENIRTLLKTSIDIVLTIIESRNLRIPAILKIAEALFEYPVNKSLYDVIHNCSIVNGTNVDYRNVIVTKLQLYITPEVLYTKVPQAMLYLKPTILQMHQVIPTLKPEQMKYVPASVVTIYAKMSVGSIKPYVELNRYWDGEEVSILRLLGEDSVDFVNSIIRVQEKYAYICDITDIDPIKFIEELVSIKNKK